LFPIRAGCTVSAGAIGGVGPNVTSNGRHVSQICDSSIFHFVEASLRKTMITKDLQDRERSAGKRHRHCVSGKSATATKRAERNSDAIQCRGLPAILEGQAEGSRHFYCARQKRIRCRL
jgi:hypothetical protein